MSEEKFNLELTDDEISTILDWYEVLKDSGEKIHQYEYELHAKLVKTIVPGA